MVRIFSNRVMKVAERLCAPSVIGVGEEEEPSPPAPFQLTR